MVRLKACCAVAPALSWTWMVNVVVWTVVGVPVMVTQCTPHWRGSFSVSPSGRTPAIRFQVNGVGPVPPLWEIAWEKNVPTLPGPSAQTPPAQASPPVLIASGGPVTVSTADTLTPPSEAVIVTSVLAGTATAVVTGNDADADPAATVTLAGTPATFRLLLDSATFVAAGAAALRVMVPVAVVPPATLAGLTVRPASAGPLPPPPPPPPSAQAGAAVLTKARAAPAASRQRTRAARRPVAYRMPVSPFCATSRLLPGSPSRPGCS